MLKLSSALSSIPQSELVLQIHDELVIEVPKESKDAAAEILKSSMETALPLLVPLVVHLSTGTRWGSLVPYKPPSSLPGGGDGDGDGEGAGACASTSTSAAAVDDPDDDDDFALRFLHSDFGDE
ncbi:hypothetical protein Pelo_19779 [Pelomyxa schiedti]|nr:hypothetical protein Pelo_19779 [Pelomyxa schiedti]